MNLGKTLFAQLMEFLPWKTFDRIVDRYGGDQRVRTLSCAEQWRVMAFAQLTYCESLRDIEACLITQARALYAHEDLGLELTNTVYALDATTIDLCLTLFPWAPFQQSKAAIKLHTLLDLRGAIPSFIHISDGRMADVTVLDLLLPEPGAFYVMDRGYQDYARFYALDQAGSFFVTRAKRNLDARRLYSAAVERRTGLICDQTIAFNGHLAARDYPAQLRRIRYRDRAAHKTLVFLTNHTRLPALTVCSLYKSRWQVELFFRWIKQHLRIKRFYGTSENAVRTQIWIAIT